LATWKRKVIWDGNPHGKSPDGLMKKVIWDGKKDFPCEVMGRIHGAHHGKLHVKSWGTSSNASLAKNWGNQGRILDAS